MSPESYLESVRLVHQAGYCIYVCSYSCHAIHSATTYPVQPTVCAVMAARDPSLLRAPLARGPLALALLLCPARAPVDNPHLSSPPPTLRPTRTRPAAFQWGGETGRKNASLIRASLKSLKTCHPRGYPLGSHTPLVRTPSGRKCGMGRHPHSSLALRARPPVRGQFLPTCNPAGRECGWGTPKPHCRFMHDVCMKSERVAGNRASLSPRGPPQALGRPSLTSNLIFGFASMGSGTPIKVTPIMPPQCAPDSATLAI